MRNFSLRQGMAAAPIIFSALLVASCSGDTTGPDQEGSASQQSDLEDQGLLVGEGYAQQEQLQEVETVLGAMREHFGEAHFTDLEEETGVEDFEAEVRPMSCGEDHYRYRVGFELEERDEPELYQRAESAVAELGLTENENNGDGSDGCDVQAVAPSM